jgi:hypothetical protein
MWYKKKKDYHMSDTTLISRKICDKCKSTFVLNSKIGPWLNGLWNKNTKTCLNSTFKYLFWCPSPLNDNFHLKKTQLGQTSVPSSQNKKQTNKQNKKKKKKKNRKKNNNKKKFWYRCKGPLSTFTVRNIRYTNW